MKNNKKTLGMIIVGLVIVFMAVTIISLLNTNHELNTKLSESKQLLTELSDQFGVFEDGYADLAGRYDEVSDDYEQLVEGIHNKYEGKEYKFTYRYDNKTYMCEGNGKLFGSTRLIMY